MSAARAGRTRSNCLLRTTPTSVIEGWFVEQEFAGAVADAEALRIAQVHGQAVGVTALKTVHASWIFSLAAVEEARRESARCVRNR